MVCILFFIYFMYQPHFPFLSSTLSPHLCHPSLIRYSSERVRLPMGSQLSLEQSVEAGPSSHIETEKGIPPHGMGFRKSAYALGILPVLLVRVP